MATSKPLNLEEDEVEPMYPSDFNEDDDLDSSANNHQQPQHFDDSLEDGPPPGFEFIEKDEQEPLPGVYFSDDDNGETVSVSVEGFGDSDEGIKVLEIKGNVETVIRYDKIDEVIRAELVCDNDCLSVVTDRLVGDCSDEKLMGFGCKNESVVKRKGLIVPFLNKKRRVSVVCDECPIPDARNQQDKAGVVKGLGAPKYFPWGDRNECLEMSRFRVSAI